MTVEYEIIIELFEKNNLKLLLNALLKFGIFSLDEVGKPMTELKISDFKENNQLTNKMILGDFTSIYFTFNITDDFF